MTCPTSYQYTTKPSVNVCYGLLFGRDVIVVQYLQQHFNDITDISNCMPRL